MSIYYIKYEARKIENKRYNKDHTQIVTTKCIRTKCINTQINMNKGEEILRKCTKYWGRLVISYAENIISSILKH